MSWFQTTPSAHTLKATIFEQMRLLGADYLEATYSGGNDEGGIDDVVLFRRAEPRKRKDVESLSIEGTLVKMQRVALPAPGYLDWEHPLHRALDELLSIDFGTWAGEFSAHGTVVADMRTQVVRREGEMSTYESDESAGEY